MKLNKFHINELSSCMVCELMAITGIFPTITGDLECSSNSASGKYDRLGPENKKLSSFSIVTKCSCDAIIFFQQSSDRTLHVHCYPLVNAMVLQRSDHLEPCAITHVCESRIFMSSKIPL